jgi:PAS domain S-box-containing protein
MRCRSVRAGTRSGWLVNASPLVAAGFDLLPTGVGIFSSDLRPAYCNAPFRELRDLPEALCRPGTPLVEIVHYVAARGDYGPGEAAEQVERRMAEIRRMQPWEVEQETPGGLRLLISHTPLPGGGLMITYSDVTEERHALVSEAVAEGIYDWDIEHNSLYVSPRLMEIFGFEGPDLSSQDWYALLHEGDRELYQDALRSCFRDRAPRVHCEYRILVRSGEYRWVEDHGLPIRNREGRAIRLVGAVSDVTQRKETEQALRESEERHELALQAINESVYEWDLVAGKMHYSRRGYAALGLAPEELKTAEDWRCRVHPDDLPGYQAATRAHLKGETERFEAEYRYRHPDGTWHWARQHGMALRAAPPVSRGRSATSQPSGAWPRSWKRRGASFRTRSKPSPRASCSSMLKTGSSCATRATASSSMRSRTRCGPGTASRT